MLMVFKKAGLKMTTESQRYGLKNKTALRVYIYVVYRSDLNMSLKNLGVEDYSSFRGG